MTIPFYKYQGTGNDFILIDNRQSGLQLSQAQVSRLCHRRFGIGADGLMLLEDAADHDFAMVYYNSDGNESTMCGNGGRCITAFARQLGLITDHAVFKAIDGIHQAQFNDNGIVALHMNDVTEIEHFEAFSILNTGSPHYVLWSNQVKDMDIFSLGRAIRNQPEFMPKGINVNFAERKADGSLYVRTYERGVEDETYSCGTGVTACAIAASGDQQGRFDTQVLTPGGLLRITFIKDTASSAKEVILTGPATFVFKGETELI